LPKTTSQRPPLFDFGLNILVQYGFYVCEYNAWNGFEEAIIKE
jgi:hypothetical protein